MTATVRLIAWTQFEPPDDVTWSTDAEGGQALAEFAGRACYQSWKKPNPATATNAGYLAHILEVGHLSVLEHGTVTFYLTGVSRSFTHELIRHRHFSYSQLSQRYVPERTRRMVEPDADRRRSGAAQAVRRGDRGQRPGVHRAAGGPGASGSPTCPTPRCGASRPGRRPGRCCPTPPRPGSWSPATTGPGGTSSRCGPPSTPTWRSASCRRRVPAAAAAGGAERVRRLRDLRRCRTAPRCASRAPSRQTSSRSMRLSAGSSAPQASGCARSR